MKRIIFSFLIILICMVALLIFKLSSGRILPRDVQKMRIGQLQELKIAVENELKINSDYNGCLYEIYKKSGKRSLFFSPTVRGSYNASLGPNMFYDTIDYGLYYQNEKWYIIEKKPDRIYPHIMMIDETGVIYEVKELR